MQYLNFKKANCKNCYKCLRECPVKAITVLGHQAKIMEDKCILCGRCTSVCHQNAKEVAGEREKVDRLLAGGRVIASVAPSFISNFDAGNFESFRAALLEYGFADAEETARGANTVVHEYKRLLESGRYKNLIASACPSIVRLIQIYHPDALKYLAPVDSPMVAHAKILRAENPGAKIVFVGPCIAKKREAVESGIIDGVLTFEELAEMLADKHIFFPDVAPEEGGCNRAKYFPVNRGIIKSFPSFPEGYEYISVDGVARCREVLDNIETLEGMFFEMNTCEFSCVNGPCSMKRAGGTIKATEELRAYARRDLGKPAAAVAEADVAADYAAIRTDYREPTEGEIAAILARTGKTAPEDELNCGACGYDTCRQKAWAVYNGLAETEMCVPYMRSLAESMSYEIIKNSPNGIIAVDTDLRVVDFNEKAKELFGLSSAPEKGSLLVDSINPVDFFLVLNDGGNIRGRKFRIEKTGAWVEMSITFVREQKMLFGIYKDITADENYRERMDKARLETADIADRVVEKQMRVVQEIASLLGETTAETKIALIKLKDAVREEKKED